MTKPASTSSLLTIDAVGVCALLGISALIYFAGVDPALRRTEELKAAFNSVGAREREAKDAEAARQDAERQTTALAATLKTAVQLMPASGLNERLATLADAARINDVALSQLTPGTPTTTSKFLSVPVRLSGTCNYAALTRMLRDIHERMPDTAISTIGIVVDPTGKEPTSAYTIDLVWYAAPAGSTAVVSAP